ncbi:hypothetical protein B0H11DRAFT_2237399 [Mycena galericulata]|nr:hypothetical protein B0H11DRAFT_2237399 [Mycena galericulata]
MDGTIQLYPFPSGRFDAEGRHIPDMVEMHSGLSKQALTYYCDKYGLKKDGGKADLLMRLKQLSENRGRWASITVRSHQRPKRGQRKPTALTKRLQVLEKERRPSPEGIPPSLVMDRYDWAAQVVVKTPYVYMEKVPKQWTCITARSNQKANPPAALKPMLPKTRMEDMGIPSLSSVSIPMDIDVPSAAYVPGPYEAYQYRLHAGGAAKGLAPPMGPSSLPAEEVMRALPNGIPKGASPHVYPAYEGHQYQCGSATGLLPPPYPMQTHPGSGPFFGGPLYAGITKTPLGPIQQRPHPAERSSQSAPPKGSENMRPYSLSLRQGRVDVTTSDLYSLVQMPHISLKGDIGSAIADILTWWDDQRDTWNPKHAKIIIRRGEDKLYIPYVHAKHLPWPKAWWGGTNGQRVRYSQVKLLIEHYDSFSDKAGFFKLVRNDSGILMPYTKAVETLRKRREPEDQEKADAIRKDPTFSEKFKYKRAGNEVVLTDPNAILKRQRRA